MCFILSHFRRQKLSRCPIGSDAETDLGQVVTASIRRVFLFLFLKKGEIIAYLYADEHDLGEKDTY